jgi:hypothetical protein
VPLFLTLPDPWEGQRGGSASSSQYEEGASDLRGLNGFEGKSEVDTKVTSIINNSLRKENFDSDDSEEVVQGRAQLLESEMNRVSESK